MEYSIKPAGKKQRVDGGHRFLSSRPGKYKIKTVHRGKALFRKTCPDAIGTDSDLYCISIRIMPLPSF
jgi:hypothetical protein